MNLFELLGSFFKSATPPAAQPAEALPSFPKLFTPLTVTLINVGVRTSRAEEFAKPLTLAMQEFGIAAPMEQAAFLANGLHETMMLRYLREVWGPTVAQKKYNNRPEKGNTNPGDGYRYRGGGFIHLTWCCNYESAGRAIGVDLKNNPERVAEPTIACRSAGHFWKSRGLNAVLAAGGFVAVVKSINGGTNGLAERERLFAALKKEFGAA